MIFNDRRNPLINGQLIPDTYGAKLPGANKPRSSAEWNARASVLAAARAGSIKEAPKRK